MTTNHIKHQIWKQHDFMGQRTEYCYDKFGGCGQNTCLPRMPLRQATP